MMRGERGARWIVGGVLLAILALVIWTMFFRTDESTRMHIGDAILSVRVADTEESRQKGLGGTTVLPEAEGMLFVYDRPDLHGIWMRDMRINIDIVWLDADKRVVHIVKNVSPDTYPKVFRPEKPAQYVLEVNAGTVDDRSITIGKEAQFDLPERSAE